MQTSARRPPLPLRIALSAYRPPRRWLGRRIADPRTPLILLGLVLVVGVGARAFHLGIPAADSRGGGGYIFDERYYISAAKVIDGVRAAPGDAYAHASPAGTDPNGEHPQLGKLIIAGSIKLFGNNAIGWRISAVLAGALALLFLYWLVLSAGGGRWLALGAITIASFENLWLVHSRIAVLDIYAVPFMLAAAALYLRRHWLLTGVLIGVACCVKEFGAYMVPILILFELMRFGMRAWDRRHGRAAMATANAPAVTDETTTPNGQAVAATPLRRRALLADPLRAIGASAVAVIVFFTLLSGLDSAVTPYSGGHPVDRNQASICQPLLIWRDACNHFEFMNSYANKLHGDTGIASRPTEWWIDRKAIPYFTVSQTTTAHGRVIARNTIVAFKGEIGRVLLFTSWIAIIFSLWWAFRRRDPLALLALAWILGTWLLPEIFSLTSNRTTYLYYMVVAMPGIYLVVARLLAWRRIPRLLVLLWFGALMWDFVALYPFHTLSGM